MGKRRLFARTVLFTLAAGQAFMAWPSGASTPASTQDSRSWPVYGEEVRSEAAEPTPRTRRYSDVKSALFAMAERYPGSSRTVEIGLSDSGEMIWGLMVAGDGAFDETRPNRARHLVVASHHGNEYGSVEVALALAESLARAPLADLVVFVVPVLNITGYNARQRYERDSAGRSWDPNRDYPGPCGTEGPFKLRSTRALAEFAERERIVASATLHTFYPAVVYPWGLPAQDLRVPDEAIFRDLARASTVESRYQIGNSTDIIYSAIGAYEDFVYWKLGAWSLLFELGSSHNPSDADMRKSIEVNVPGLRRMLEVSPRTTVANHEFTSRCDLRRLGFDRRDE